MNVIRNNNLILGKFANAENSLINSINHYKQTFFEINFFPPPQIYALFFSTPRTKDVLNVQFMPCVSREDSKFLKICCYAFNIIQSNEKQSQENFQKLIRSKF